MWDTVFGGGGGGGKLIGLKPSTLVDSAVIRNSDLILLETI